MLKERKNNRRDLGREEGKREGEKVRGREGGREERLKEPPTGPWPIPSDLVPSPANEWQ